MPEANRQLRFFLADVPGACPGSPWVPWAAKDQRPKTKDLLKNVGDAARQGFPGRARCSFSGGKVLMKTSKMIMKNRKVIMV
jgi:hypothetical protein